MNWFSDFVFLNNFVRRWQSFPLKNNIFTFALGTVAGDLVAEKFRLGYLLSGFIY